MRDAGDDHHRRVIAALVGVVLVATLLVSPVAPLSPASAAPPAHVGAVTLFALPAGTHAAGIAAGADGNLWFTDNVGRAVGRMTTAGAVSVYRGTGAEVPRYIAAGPDGNLWFTNSGSNSIGRVTPSGVVTTFTDDSIRVPSGIVAGPDGNLWFTSSAGASIGRITTSGVVTSFSGEATDHAEAITAGPDGNLWFTNQSGNRIGRITPAGVVTSFADPAVQGPIAIAPGPDGNLWFTNNATVPASIGRITTDGVVSTFSAPWLRQMWGIAAGPDGNLWFTSSSAPGVEAASIGRITPAGVISRYPSPSMVNPLLITPGPDGAMWVADFSDPGGIGRINITGIDIPGPPTAAAATTGPRSATVTWAAPASDGGAPVSGYTVTSSPEGKSCTWVSGPLSCVVSGLTAGVPHTFTVAASNVVGEGPPSAATPAVTPIDAAGSSFHAVAPTRILDSRGPVGSWNGRLAAGTPRTLTVAGGATGIPATASAVVLNVTATGADANSFLSVYPAGSAVPTASNVNFAAGATVPNLVTVAVGTDGRVALANAAGATDVVVDLAGYYDLGPGDRYTSVTPTRVLDSRGSLGGWGGRLAAGAPRPLQVRGVAGVPSSADAVVMNLTATGSTANSFLSVSPAAGATTSSNLNVAAGQTVANLVTVKLNGAGAVDVATAVGSVDVIADVAGYFDASNGDLFHPLAPTRVLDSRTVLGWFGRLEAGAPRALAVAGHDGIAAQASAVVANATVTDADANSFLTVFPGGAAVPVTSTLNFAMGQTVPNLVVVGVGPGGTVSFANAVGSTQVVFDIAGYYAPT